MLQTQKKCWLDFIICTRSLIEKQCTAIGHLWFTELQLECARERTFRGRLDELASQVDILEAAIGHD